MIKRILPVIFLFPALSANTVLAQPDKYFEIPLTIRANIILIKLLVNNQPATFIVDTGASVSLLDKNQASKYDFTCYENYGTGEINSLSGINALLPIGGIRLKYEYLTFRKFRFYGSNFDPLHHYFTKKNISILGIMGADFLIRNKAVIDYQNKKLILKI